MGKKTGGKKRQLARKTHLQDGYVGGTLDWTHLLIISGWFRIVEATEVAFSVG